MSEHSSLVGGSSAARAIACPWSIANRDLALPDEGSDFAREGTMLHAAVEQVVNGQIESYKQLVGLEVAGVTFHVDHVDTVVRAVQLFDEYLDELEIEEGAQAETRTEVRVGFGDAIPDAFGTADIIGRCGTVAIVADWKFGTGVEVVAEDNDQLLFYAAAARRTEPALFEGATEIGLLIIQPSHGRSVWTVAPAALDAFELQLKLALAVAHEENPTIAEGKHCRWCPVKHACPLKQDTGQRAILAAAEVAGMTPEVLGGWLDKVSQMEDFIRSIRDLGHKMASAGQAPVGWMLAPKRAIRKWIDENDAAAALIGAGCKESDLYSTTLCSPAQAEKLLKPMKVQLPDGLTSAVSSGDTLVRDDGHRPAAGNLAAGLRKLAMA